MHFVFSILFWQKNWAFAGSVTALSCTSPTISLTMLLLPLKFQILSSAYKMLTCGPNYIVWMFTVISFTGTFYLYCDFIFIIWSNWYFLVLSCASMIFFFFNLVVATVTLILNWYKWNIFSPMFNIFWIFTGKKPGDSLNPKAVNYMQSVFSVKDTIGKKETREISTLCGITVTQVVCFLIKFSITQFSSFVIACAFGSYVSYVLPRKNNDSSVSTLAPFFFWNFFHFFSL